MDMGKYKNFKTVEDFVLDRNFIHWAVSQNEDLNLFWNSFIKENPEKKVLIKEALLIIHSVQPVQQEVPQYKLDEIFQKVKIRGSRSKLTRYRYLKYAAVLVFFIGLSNLVYFSIFKEEKFPIENSSAMFKKGKVIFSDGSIKKFNTKLTPITQTSSGNLIVNNDTIEVKSKNKSTALNQIIIPYGKRSDIRLADGTHVWLNSGSTLSYPTEFSGSLREVYLSGEAFFEVTPNVKKPFYVNTRDVKIKVLGTSFNVCAYSDDNTVQTVLVRGKVTEGKNKKFANTIDLKPGERLIYNKIDKNLLKDKVDVRLYSSWIKGYLVFDNVQLKEVCIKLERYYNRDIIVDKSLERISFSGKLDLNNDIKDVLDNIAFASYVNVLEKDETYIIKN